MIYYGGVLIADSDLSHHGILGQKWGRRNGPPYPLSAGRHSASEKKAGYQKSIGGSGGTYGKIKRKKPNPIERSMINSTQKRLEKINSKKQNKNTKASQEATQRYLDESARENARVAQEQNRIAQENAQRQMNDAAQQQINQTNMQNMMMFGKDDKKISERKNGVTNDYGSFKSKREERKKAKVEKNVKERLAEIKKNDPEQYEQIKKNTIRTGKASDMKYFVDDMDNQELQYAINRIESKAKLNQLSNKEVKTNWDRAKEVSEKLKIVADLTTNAANIYTNLNKMTPSSNNQNNQQQQKKKN